MLFELQLILLRLAWDTYPRDMEKKELGMIIERYLKYLYLRKNEELPTVALPAINRKMITKMREYYKVINNDRFREALRSRLGPEYEEHLLPWLRRVSSAAKRNNAELKAADSVMRWLRVNTTITAMGLRVSTGVQQVSGYILSMQRLGTKYMLKGMAEYFVNIPRARDTVYEMSAFMRNRANNYERDTKAAVDKHKGKSAWKQGYVRWAFRGIALMDLAVSIPTWQGAYMKGLAEGLTEADAIYYADKMVRDTQGGGSTLDITASGDALAYRVTPISISAGVTPQLTTATAIIEE